MTHPKGYTDPTTLETFTFDHMAPFEVTYPVRLKDSDSADSEIEVEIQVIFSNHCYTRSKASNDPAELPILFKEKKRDGTVDERVFCSERWNFSKSLPDLIRALNDKNCLAGGSREIFYRIEHANPPGTPEGWYICFKLDASEKYKNLTLSVRSAHYRTNRPNDVRGGFRRFYAILAKFFSEELEKKPWLIRRD